MLVEHALVFKKYTEMSRWEREEDFVYKKNIII